MCGLVALMSVKDNGFSVNEGAMLSQSMIFNQLRGDDSTGLALVDNIDRWSFLKVIGGFKALSKHHRWSEFDKDIMNIGRLAFGHGRWATRGMITLDNAHPFSIKDKNREQPLVFMHNGTLETTQTLPGFYGFSVDSEWLGSVIASYGAEQALSEARGAVACQWWDANENTFNFYRNADRPLHYMHSKDGTIYINSEKWILEYLNYRFKLKISEKNIYMIQDQDLHSIKVNGPEAGKFNITKIKKPSKPKIPIHSAGYSRYGEAYNTFYGEVEDDAAIAVLSDNFRQPAYSHSFGPPKNTPPMEDKAFWNRDIETVEWIDNKRIVTYKNRQVCTFLNEAPPEPGLLRMYEMKMSGDIMRVYQGKPGKGAVYEIQRYNDRAKRVTLPESQGETISFQTQQPQTNVKVTHTGLVLTGKSSPHLQSYTNTLDGSVGLEEEVLVEIVYLADGVSNKTATIKAVCCRVKEQPDTYIDYVFHCNWLSKAEIEKARFFTGKIGAITLQDKSDTKATGTVVVCNLYSIKVAQLDKKVDNVATKPAVH